MAYVEKIVTFREMLNADRPIGIVGILAIIIMITGIIGISVYAGLWLYVFPVLIATPFVFLIVIRPKVWLYLISASLPMFFHVGDEGVSVFDVVIGLFYIGSISVYFVRKALILHQKIAENWGDWAILTFFTLLLFNFLIAYFNDVPPMDWIREYLLISIMLIYFPVRDVLRDEKDINSFLIFLGIIIIFTGSYQVLEYYRKVNTNVIYAYELKSTISINQVLYTAASVYGLIFAFSQKSKYKEIFVIGLTSMYVVFLITTFSRTFWLILLAIVILMFFLLPAKKKILFLTYMSIIIAVVMIAAFLFMRDKADIALSVVFSRFESTSEGRKDASLIARFKEWEKVEYLVMQNPLGGNGLAKTFSFHFPINSRARHTHIIHNGYLWLAYRTGIPMALLFLFFTLYYTYKSGILIKYAKNQTQRALLIAAFSTMLSFYVMNITAALYFVRDGIFVTAFSVAFIGICERLIIQNKDLAE